jgi:hypothetical protein
VTSASVACTESVSSPSVQPRAEAAGRRLDELDRDVLEAERVADALAHRLEDLPRVEGLGKPRGDAEQLLERGPVARGVGRRLRGLDGERRVLGDSNEDVELLVARPASGARLVNGENPEQVSGAVPHRHDQRVLRMPGVRVVGRLDVRHERRHVGEPVELLVRDQVGAVAQEALVEERLPRGEVARVTEQRLARARVAVDVRHHEVVPRGPVEVDRHRPEAEALRDGARDRLEDRVEVVLAADEARDLEEAAQVRESRLFLRHSSRCRQCSSLASAAVVQRMTPAEGSPEAAGKRKFCLLPSMTSVWQRRRLDTTRRGA